MRALHLLVIVWLAGCTSPDREPIAVHSGRPKNSLPPPPPEDPGLLEEGTAGLLERLLAQPGSDAAGAPDGGVPDERPVCLDLGFEAGAGPFRSDGHDLPRAAAEAALSDALTASFGAGGALAGPLAIGWDELFHPGDEGLPAVLDPPLPQPVLERARALGGAFLLAGRLERLEHQRVSAYVVERSRYERRERGRVRLWFQLFELEHGSLLCTELIERTCTLDGLTPAELASSELVLAELAALEIRTALEACLGAEPPVR